MNDNNDKVKRICSIINDILSTSEVFKEKINHIDIHSIQSCEDYNRLKEELHNYKTKYNEVETKYQEYTQKKILLEQKNQYYETRIKDLEHQLHKYHNDNNEIKQQYKLLKEQTEKYERELKSSYEYRLNTQIQQSKQQLEHQSKQIEEYKKQIEELQKYKDLYEGSNKGIYYEQEFYKQICNYNEQHLGQVWNIEYVSSEPHKGDFILTHQYTHFSVMIDTKNYSSTVPKREITKFRKDLTEYSSCHYGILISTTHISNTPPYTYEEFHNQNKHSLQSLYDTQTNRVYPCNFQYSLYIPEFTFSSNKLFFNILDNIHKHYIQKIKETSSHIQTQTLINHFKYIYDIHCKFNNTIKELYDTNQNFKEFTEQSYMKFKDTQNDIPSTLTQCVQELNKTQLEPKKNKRKYKKQNDTTIKNYLK